MPIRVLELKVEELLIHLPRELYDRLPRDLDQAEELGIIRLGHYQGIQLADAAHDLSFAQYHDGVVDLELVPYFLRSHLLQLSGFRLNLDVFDGSLAKLRLGAIPAIRYPGAHGEARPAVICARARIRLAQRLIVELGIIP